MLRLLLLISSLILVYFAGDCAEAAAREQRTGAVMQLEQL